MIYLEARIRDSRRESLLEVYLSFENLSLAKLRSRTFFRLSGGNIRFLAVDEPTSALDPEGEFELLSKLQELRGEKTVVFITHRFGHLTRFADLIL